MAQNKVLMLTVATTIATAVVEVLVELGRKPLTADLFHIEGAEQPSPACTFSAIGLGS